MAATRGFYRWFYDNIHCHYYDIVTWWCFLPLGGEVKVRKALTEVVGVKAGDRVLEMCCGTGGATSYLAAKAGKASRVRAIDLSTGQIRMARRKNLGSNIEFAVMDASHTSFRDGDFDKVVIPHALHEMPRAERLDVLREARRVLADGGVLAVLELDIHQSAIGRICLGLWWFYWLPFNPETPTRRDMLKHGVVGEVKEAGFRDVRKTGFFGGALQVVTGRR